MAYIVLSAWLLVLLSSVQSLLTRQDIVEKYILNATNAKPTIVPDFDQEVATNVSVQLRIDNMYSISETSMEYSIDVLLRQFWRDHRLDFSAENVTFETLEIDKTNMDKVWQPDIYFKNEKRAFIHSVTDLNKLMHVKVDGSVVYSMRLSLTLVCSMALEKYPFDAQVCPITVQSFGYSISNINLNWYKHKSVSVQRLHLPKFHLSEEFSTNDYVEKHEETGSFSSLTVKLFIERQVGYYFLQVFLPSVFLVVLSWISFWVDPKAVPARVSLGVTCVLTMTTQSAGIRQTLPPVSYVKAIDIWMTVCLMFVFAALLEFAYVNVVGRRKDPEEEVSEDEEKGNEKSSKLSSVFKRCTQKRNKIGNVAAMRADRLSRVMFPLLFLLFVLVFALVAAYLPDPTILDH